MQNIVSLPRFQANYPFPERRILTLKFRVEEEEVTKTFDPEVLMHFPFFKTCMESNFSEAQSNEIFLQDSSVEDITMLCDLFCDDVHILDVLTPDQLGDPDFYEHLETQMRFFLLEKTDAFIERMQEQMRSLPYVHAQTLLENHQKMFGMPINDEKEKEEGEGKGEIQPEPFYLKPIQEIIANSLYFESPDEYEKNHLEELRNVQRGIAGYTWLLNKNKREMNLLESKRFNLSQPFQETINFQESKLELLTKSIQQIYETFDRTKLTKSELASPVSIRPSRLLKASKFIKENQDLAKRYLKIYKEKILSALQYQSEFGFTRMHRKDLINKSIDLFAYYDFVPSNYSEGIRGTCFKNYLNGLKDSYDYLFDNKDINALETKMRDDLIQTGLSKEKLPPVLFNEDFVESFHPPFVIDGLDHLRQLFPLLKKLDKTTEEIKEMKMTLILHWGWDKLGIVEDDFRLSVLPQGIKDEDIDRVKGTLTKFGNRVNFFFRTDKFLPIIFDYALDPIPRATKEYLIRLFNKSKERENCEE